MLMVTDVVSGSSRLLLTDDPPRLGDLPYPRLSDGTRLAEGVVSRKKQLLPVVLGLLEGSIMSVYRALAELEDKNGAGALCILIRSQGSTPRHTGSKMLVYPDGTIAGTVGGGELESRVIQLRFRRSRTANRRWWSIHWQIRSAATQACAVVRWRCSWSLFNPVRRSSLSAPGTWARRSSSSPTGWDFGLW